MKTTQTLKFIPSLVLMGCLLSAPQAFGKEWDLSDAKPNQPVCLNCCMSSLHQGQCDAEFEKLHLDSFPLINSMFALPLVSSLLTIAALKYYPVIGIFGIFYSIKLISLNILYTNSHLSNSKSYSFETDTHEPEGIVLWVRAESDWNGALAFPVPGSLSK